MKRVVLFGLLLAGLGMARPGHAQDKKKSSAASPPAVPLSVSAAQIQIRSLEKWISVPVVVMTLPAPRQARLVAHLKLSDLADPVKKGQAVRAPLSLPRSGSVQGVVDRVSQNPAEGTVRVELLVENPGQIWAVGQSLTADVRVVKRPNALVVPVAAIAEEGKKIFVFKLDHGSGKSKAKKVEVRAGYSDGQWTEIRLGLWPGQWLAASQLKLLTDGALVLASPTPR